MARKKSKFDQMLDKASRDAAKLAPWKKAFLAQVDNAGRYLSGKKKHGRKDLI